MLFNLINQSGKKNIKSIVNDGFYSVLLVLIQVKVNITSTWHCFMFDKTLKTEKETTFATVCLSFITCFLELLLRSMSMEFNRKLLCSFYVQLYKNTCEYVCGYLLYNCLL